MASNRDHKRTTESKINTQSVRTIRKKRRTELEFTDRSFHRLIRQGL